VDNVLDKMAQLIREEFDEAPDLRMTVREASKFWALDERTCGQVLGRLLDAGYLAKGGDERYGRAA
jgi:hypothetical protein